MAFVYRPVKIEKSGGKRVRTRTAFYWARYTDPQTGEPAQHVLTLPSGERISDRQTAEAALRDLIQQRQRLAAGLTDVYVAAAQTPVVKLAAAYVRHLRRKRHKGRRLARRYVLHAVRVCRFIVRHGAERVADLRADRIDRALGALAHLGKSAKTVTTYRATLHALCGYAVRVARVLEANPVPMTATHGVQPEKQRRALTPHEAAALLDVARRRPVAEYGRLTMKVKREGAERKRSNWKAAPLTPNTLDAAEHRGEKKLKRKPAVLKKLQERGERRALWYEAALLTGLRVGELAALRWTDVDLGSLTPCIRLRAQTTKAARADTVPLRRSLAAKLKAIRPASAREPIFPGRFTPTLRTFHADCAAAGIPTVDERGRELDRHALRTTFVSWLSMTGTAPRTAQKLARHATIDLTMGAYTDDRLLDGVSAIENLPDLTPAAPDRQRQRATGTDNRTSTLTPVALPVALKGRKRAGTAENVLSAPTSYYPAESSETLEITLPFADMTKDSQRARRDSNAQPTGSKPATLSS